MLAGAKLAEILGSLRDNIGEKLHLDAPDRGARNGDIKEHNRVLRVGRNPRRHGSDRFTGTSHKKMQTAN